MGLSNNSDFLHSAAVISVSYLDCYTVSASSA